jgi:hypothetical protein
MRIVRALWGNSEYIRSEIPKIPLFGEKEIVFVWGKENKELLDKYGYKSLLVKDTQTDPKYSSHLLHFAHKLKAIQLAEGFLNEFLFLDWDISLAKELDEVFYEKIRLGNDIQIPLYGYHGEYREDVEKYLKEKNRFSLNSDDFLYNHILNLEKYHWKLNDLKILPCFCFLYIRGKFDLGKKLLDIMNEQGVVACIEEFTFQIYCNCSLEEYINKYEPLVLRGKETDKNLPGMAKAIKEINHYISGKVKKDIYLYHDLN